MEIIPALTVVAAALQLISWMAGSIASVLTKRRAVAPSATEPSSAGSAVVGVASTIVLPGVGPAIGTAIGYGAGILADISSGRRIDPAQFVRLRLEEASAALMHQLRMARWHKSAALLLTFSQFIVGGVLASSFAQQSVSPSIMGALGLLVLMASLVRQHYQPDVESAAARARVTRLRALLREIEDELLLRDDAELDLSTARTLSARIRTTLEATEAIEAKELKESRATAPTS